MKTARLFLALSLSVGLLMAGCSSESSSDGKGEEGDKVTLRIGTWEGGEGQAMQQKIADEYMAKNPEVKIEIESVPDQYGTKLLTQIAAGDAPDIFQIGDGDIRTFMEKGAFEELTPFVNGDNGINEDDYYENVLDVGKINDKLYTMPKDYSTLAVFYNKELFDKAGVAYPEAGWTWDDFYEKSKKLTEKDNGKIVQWGVRLGGAEQRFIIPLLYSYGGSLISEDGKKIDGYLNSDESKTAFNIYNDMYFKDEITPSNSDTEAFKGVDLFGAGKVAMNVMGRWPVNNYNSNPDLKYGTVEMPQGPKGNVNSIFYAGYGVYSKSKHKDAAWDYLKYLTGKEGATVFADHGFTAVKSVAEEKGQTEDSVLKPFLDGIEHIQIFPEQLSPHYPTSGARDVFGKFMERFMTDKEMDIDKELDKAAKESEELLKAAEK